MKRVLLSAVLCLASILAWGYTSDTCGANLTWTLTDDGTLTISGTGEMYDFVSSSPPWRYSNIKVKTVLIEQGVTSIGGYAFSDCRSLTSVTLPESVTSIGYYAFYNCSSLTSVTIPEGVTSIGRSVFSGCSGLTEIIVKAVTPPVVETNTFFGVNVPVSVPEEAMLDYVKADGWKDFKLRTENFIAIGTCGANLTWTLTDDGTLTISGSGEMGSYSDFWSSNRNKFKTVLIEQGVMSIGSEAFSGCRSLTSITIPESVTSIGHWAFRNCSKLTAITIPESVTSIGDEAFSGCSSLNTLYYNAIHCDDIYTCGWTSINTLHIGEKVEIIPSRAFQGCRKLTSVTIPEGVTSIGDNAFWSCSNLATITIPESVTSIGSDAFYDCSSLNTLYYNAIHCGDISSSCGWTYINTLHIGEKVEIISSRAFEGCRSLNTLYYNAIHCDDIGDYISNSCGWTPINTLHIGEKVEIIPSRAFQGCHKLTSVTLPQSVTSIGESAFSGCSSLTAITLPESVTSIGNSTFSGCSGLTSISLPESVTSIGESAFSGCSGLTAITLPESVTSIGESAFSGCSGLTSISLPESVTSIGNSAFSGCSSLTAIILPESVTSIGNSAFDGCSSLTSISLPESVTSIGNSTFSGCSGLTAITLPEGVTSIGSSVFSGCSGLAEITVKAVTPPVVETNTFSGVSVPVSVPEEAMMDYLKADGWKDLNLRTENYFTIGLCGSNLCWGLTDNGTLNISGSGEMDDYDAYSSPVPWSSHRNSFLTVQVTQGVTSIGAYAFSGCRNLASVILPESVTSIGDYAFEACRILTSVTLPESLTSIGSGAFYDCSGLTSISLPESVTNIGHYAFSGCSYLTQMAVSATTPPAVGIGVFNGVSRSIPVHVPAESLTAYQSADVWKEFNLQAMASTGLGSVTALEQSIEVCNGEIILNRADRPLVSLYDLGGRLVHQSHDCRIAVPHPGTYILRVGQEAVKVMMR